MGMMKELEALQLEGRGFCSWTEFACSSHVCVGFLQLPLVSLPLKACVC